MVRPCRLEMPDLNDFYSRFKSQGLVVLSITNEESLKVSSFVSETGYRAPVLLDSESRPQSGFTSRTFPEASSSTGRVSWWRWPSTSGHAANSSRCLPRPVYVPNLIPMQIHRQANSLSARMDV